MSSDLVVKDELLEDSEKRLRRLSHEFDEANIAHHKDEIRHIWGCDTLADTMGDFVDNWDYYRKKLLGNINSVGEMVSATREAFNSTDEKLKKNLSGKHS